MTLQKGVILAGRLALLPHPEQYQVVACGVCGVQCGLTPEGFLRYQRGLFVVCDGCMETPATTANIIRQQLTQKEK